MNKIAKLLPIVTVCMVVLIIILCFTVKAKYRLVISEEVIPAQVGYVTKQHYDLVKLNDIDELIYTNVNKTVIFIEDNISNDLYYDELGISYTINSNTSDLIDNHFMLNINNLKVDYNTEYLESCLASFNDDRSNDRMLDITSIANDIRDNIGSYTVITFDDYYIK